MPVHPLKGLKLDVVRIQREDSARRRTVVAELPGGGGIVLPIEWTDRGPPWAAPTVDGQQVRLSARGLLQSAQAVETALGQKLDKSLPTSSGSEQTEHASKNLDVGSRGTARGMGATDADDAAGCAGRVGEPAAQGRCAKRGR